MAKKKTFENVEIERKMTRKLKMEHMERTPSSDALDMPLTVPAKLSRAYSSFNGLQTASSLPWVGKGWLFRRVGKEL